MLQLHGLLWLARSCEQVVRAAASTFTGKCCGLLLVGTIGYVALGQLAPSLPTSQATAQERDKKKGRPEEPPPRPLPDDKRLLSLHLDFVKKAEKLGLEYETDKDWGKARQVYEEILKLVPQYPPARSKLAEMLSREAAAQSHQVTIDANKGWQDCGITLQVGRPISIAATGNWTFHLQVETNAEGLTIPEELRDFKLGCLIARIDGADPKESKPFVVGSGMQFQAPSNGRLLLRMYDTDPRDNDGSLKIEIRGTFDVDRK